MKKLIPILILLPYSCLARDATVTVSYSPGHPANIIRPFEAFGAGVDGHERGDISKMLSPYNVRLMQSAGFKSLTYRLRTELGVEAWHWNPQGRWSAPAHQQGYFTGDSQLGAKIDICYGYRLPRRGSSTDQANNDGYSRIVDGSVTTFWKSNPYLDTHYTGDNNDMHPQWVVANLDKLQPVDTIRLLWGTPYARRYVVEYWDGEDALQINDHPDGRWREFPGGRVSDGKGGDVTLKLCAKPKTVNFVRISMTESSCTAPRESRDIRDSLGFALKEIYIGRLNAKGRLVDIIKHGKRRENQTTLYTSSTDPWHASTDIDYNFEQPGFDRIYASGLTNNMPMMVPVPVLYNTPDTAAAELLWLKAKGYPADKVEMGEEPDGQYVSPEDYGALYVQTARAIRRHFPTIALGGPCFQTTETDVVAWPDKHDSRTWMGRFLAYLKQKGHLKDFQFFSFEWYPYDNTLTPTAPQLAGAPDLLSGVLKRLQGDGLSTRIPWYITEYGYSAFSGRAEVDIEGALLNADIVGQFLTLGGDRAYLYGYEPNYLIEEYPGAWGNNMILQADDNGRAKWRIATYWGARMLTRDWVVPGMVNHEIYPAESDLYNNVLQKLITAYAIKRPDGLWGILLINKDPAASHRVMINMIDLDSGTVFKLSTGAKATIFSREQYRWAPSGEYGHPVKSLPPAPANFSNDGAIMMPPYSMCVVKGKFDR